METKNLKILVSWAHNQPRAIVQIGICAISIKFAKQCMPIRGFLLADKFGNLFHFMRQPTALLLPGATRISRLWKTQMATCRGSALVDFASSSLLSWFSTHSAVLKVSKSFLQCDFMFGEAMEVR